MCYHVNQSLKQDPFAILIYLWNCLVDGEVRCLLFAVRWGLYVRRLRYFETWTSFQHLFKTSFALLHTERTLQFFTYYRKKQLRS
mmetsp:Transcript_6033/g.13219  ORF Transcript_6033/g.13219 Transcript_6033/m.13219 type:complete len:85 (+) Transcript_6033:354-608(+)